MYPIQSSVGQRDLSMVEKIKKGSLRHCVTALLLFFLSGNTYIQASLAHLSDDEEQTINITSEYDDPTHEEDDTLNNNEVDDFIQETPSKTIKKNQRRISNIIISGNKFTSSNAISNLIPYKIGEIFDQRKTRSLIHNLYYGLKKFRTIKVYGEPINDNFITIHVIVEEKTPLAEIKTSGNSHVSDKEIAKKITTFVKNSKVKVQAQIQGDHVRITGKSRDDLQMIMAMLRKEELGLPLQFENFRD